MLARSRPPVGPRTIGLAAAIAGIALGTVALAADTMPPNVKTETINGHQVLADSQGMALYTFAKDKPGHSVCIGGCADYWPPLMAPSGFSPSGDWSVVKRPDGSDQLAHQGKPLYTFSKDQPGQDKGDGFRGVWHVATVAGG